VKSDLYLALWDAFKSSGIEIPFPQREVRLLS
jgi:small-conductance mechanosensitive channel